jgi:hypothetical protein
MFNKEARPMRYLLLSLFCLAATAASSEIGPYDVEGDFDGDGRDEIVMLFDSVDGWKVDLVIMTGDENTVYDPALVLARGDDIASAGRQGELVTLDRSPAGSILLAYGPRAARTTLTIAFREQAFRVIGFTQEDTTTGRVCDLNLLTGKGELKVGAISTAFKSNELKPLPISEWKEIDVFLPSACM